MIRAALAMTILVLGSSPSFASAELKEGNYGALGTVSADQDDCEPAPTSAATEFCSRFTTENGAAQCLQASNNRYFAQCALDLCNRFNTEIGGINCLLASRDKDYTRAEMNVCDRFTTEDGAVQCLRSAGRLHAPGNPDLTQAKRRVADALDLLNNNRIERAKVELEDLLRDLGGLQLIF